MYFLSHNIFLYIIFCVQFSELSDVWWKTYIDLTDCFWIEWLIHFFYSDAQSRPSFGQIIARLRCLQHLVIAERRKTCKISNKSERKNSIVWYNIAVPGSKSEPEKQIFRSRILVDEKWHKRKLDREVLVSRNMGTEHSQFRNVILQISCCADCSGGDLCCKLAFVIFM